MTPILKNHFALNRTDYLRGLIEGRYCNQWPTNLSLRRVEATEAVLSREQGRLSDKWYWNEQPRYHDGSLAAKLADKETALYHLLDSNEPIGYALVSAPAPDLKTRFWGAANASVIEIENLGLYPGNEGGGRGKSYFEMLFNRYFKTHEAVYWSQHETHAPTLRQFYQKKMGMTLLATDYVEDFRPQSKPHAARAAALK